VCYGVAGGPMRQPDNSFQAFYSTRTMRVKVRGSPARSAVPHTVSSARRDPEVCGTSYRCPGFRRMPTNHDAIPRVGNSALVAHPIYRECREPLDCNAREGSSWITAVLDERTMRRFVLCLRPLGAPNGGNDCG